MVRGMAALTGRRREVLMLWREIVGIDGLRILRTGYRGEIASTLYGGTLLIETTAFRCEAERQSISERGHNLA